MGKFNDAIAAPRPPHACSADDQCPLPATMTHSTRGSERWVCRPHWVGAMRGEPAWQTTIDILASKPSTAEAA